MLSAIVVTPQFDGTWPFAADHAHALWRGQLGPVLFRRLSEAKDSVEDAADLPPTVTRLLLLGPPHDRVLAALVA